MRQFIGILIAMLTMTTSLASWNTPQSGNVLSGKPTATVALQKIATQKDQVHVKSRIPKPKLFRSNPYRLAHFALIDDQDDIFIADDDLATGYRRRDLGKIEQQEEAPLPENIRWRLFLARQLAMMKFREIHG